MVDKPSGASTVPAHIINALPPLDVNDPYSLGLAAYALLDARRSKCTGTKVVPCRCFAMGEDGHITEGEERPCTVDVFDRSWLQSLTPGEFAAACDEIKAAVKDI